VSVFPIDVVQEGSLTTQASHVETYEPAQMIPVDTMVINFIVFCFVALLSVVPSRETKRYPTQTERSAPLSSTSDTLWPFRADRPAARHQVPR
jgi:hypothetical protein